MNNSTLSCPKCGSTSLYKNGHDKYGNQQFLCKLCHHSFKLSHSQKRKNFPFPYPKCSSCGKAMEIHKVRRSFVVFRCRTRHTKDRVPFNFPEPVTFIPENFKYFRFPLFFVLKAFVLYMKHNMSYRSLAHSLNIKVSHVTIYKWVIKLCTLFSVLFPTFTIENVFSVHADETVLVFKEQKYYVWLLVDHETNLILCWHVSKYRDMGQVKVLLEKFFGNSKPRNIELITDGLGAYESAVKLLFRNINHVVVPLGKNNQCESKFSLLKDFFRLKRGLKNTKNLAKYIQGFCVVKNLWKTHNGNINCILSHLHSFITTS
ncbi:transposase [Fervidobacterium ngatamarikiense]|uniref:Transposase n=1 Tax=Fervidobacterium pennivorans TaxID=93466 RepID=A0A172T1P5_FERPE|nr:DDE-type integrase/transposase/recombinase [Fervidobacterium pennivorans]ANE40874.1 transposase [Fervidobacterium pennivorans]